MDWGLVGVVILAAVIIVLGSLDFYRRSPK
jgi:hypothetical protein